MWFGVPCGTAVVGTALLVRVHVYSDEDNVETILGACGVLLPLEPVGLTHNNLR